MIMHRTITATIDHVMTTIIMTSIAITTTITAIPMLMTTSEPRRRHEPSRR